MALMSEHWKAAYHEAGHAVTATLLGIPVMQVSLNDGGGGTTKIEPSFPAETFIDSPEKYRQEIENLIVYMCAGYSAQDLYCPIVAEEEGDEGKVSDYASAHYYAKLLHPENGRGFMDELDVRSEELVKKEWPIIKQVATRLVRRAIISGDDLRTMMKAG